jgi:DNA-nicking Smr family endonuclease
MPRRRTLRPEEEALWQVVARSAQPLSSKRKLATSAAVRPALIPAATAPEPKPVALPLFRVGEKAFGPERRATLPGLALTPDPAALRMDKNAFDRMKRGKLSPEARIDLHGLTVGEAHADLIRFVLNAHAAGRRLILVITGKGRPGGDQGPIPQRTGVLKQQVPMWLRLAPLGGLVLQVTEAHARHGGAGALYVYLRRAHTAK